MSENISFGPYSDENIFQVEVPAKLVFGLVLDTSYHGDVKHNPYNFVHSNICYVGVRVNDVLVPKKPYTPLFSDTQINSASVFKALYKDHPGAVCEV